MKQRVINFLKYLFILTLTAFLLWFSYQQMEVGDGQSKSEYLLQHWRDANKFFLVLSGVLLLTSHFIRAERWKLLLSPLKHNISSSSGFLTVMTSYFINLVIPRGGEVSRCYYLSRLEKVPVQVSLGTVMAERIIDLVFLALFIAAAFLVEFDNLSQFFSGLDMSEDGGPADSVNWVVYALLSMGMIFLLFVVYLYIYRRSKAFRLWLKGKHFLRGLKEGLLAVFNLEQRGKFIFYSMLIWLLYYLMMYVVMLAFKETSNLGFLAAVSIFAIGGIAMAAPLPGGAGSYHVLVPLGLVTLYGLSQEQSTAFTFIFHGWQTLVTIIVGGLALIITQRLLKGTKDGDSE